MDTKNASAQQPDNHPENDCQNCRMRIVVDTDLVECLMEIIRCKWASPFGDTRFCKHPSAKQFALSRQP